VAEASVYGIANPITGFILGADVVPSDAGGDPGPFRAAVLAELRERLESYKVPRILKVIPALVLSKAGKKERVR
jgi:acyl-CoA synthetase (AMP-forming)/AMP-acid ligase II